MASIVSFKTIFNPKAIVLNVKFDWSFSAIANKQIKQEESPVTVITYCEQEKTKASVIIKLNDLRLPGLIISHHGIQKDQKLVHTSGYSHFFELTFLNQTLVKSFDWRVKTNCN